MDFYFSRGPKWARLFYLFKGGWLGLLATIFAFWLPDVGAQTLTLEPIVVRAKPVTQSIETEEFKVDLLGVSDTLSQMQLAPGLSLELPTKRNSLPDFKMRGQRSIQNRFFLQGIPLSEAQFQQSMSNLVPPHALGELHLSSTPSKAQLASDGFGGAVEFDLKPLSPKRITDLGWAMGSEGYQRLELAQRWEKKKGALYLDLEGAQENFEYFNDQGTPYTTADDSFSKRRGNGFQRLRLLTEVPVYQKSKKGGRLILAGLLEQDEIPGRISRPTEGQLETQSFLGGFLHQQEAFEVRLYGKLSLQHLTGWQSPLRGGGNQKSQYHCLGFRSRGRLIAQRSVPLWAALGADYESFQSVRDQKDPDAQSRLSVPWGLWMPFEWGEFALQPELSSHFFWSGKIQTEQNALGDQADLGLLLSPRVWWNWRAHDQLRIFGYVGHFYRMPSLQEKFGQAPYFEQNLSLRAERSLQASLGMDWRVQPLGLKSMVLGVRMTPSWNEDLILLQQNAQNLFTSQNIGQSRMLSMEFLGDLLWSSWMETEWSFQGLWSENLSQAVWENGRVLPMRPEFVASMSQQFHLGNLSLGYQLQYNGAFFLDTSNLIQTEPQWTHSLFLSQNLGSWGGLRFQVTNLTDVKVGNYLVLDQRVSTYRNFSPGFPSPGRQFQLFLKVSI